MEHLWKPAIAVGGIAAIGALVFFSLYKEWLKLPIFSQLTPTHTFILMVIFLSLTFLSLVAMLGVYIKTKSPPIVFVNESKINVIKKVFYSWIYIAGLYGNFS